MFRPVILEENQKRHVGNNFKSCLNYGHFEEGSDTGTGKTPCAIALAQKLSKHHNEKVYLCVIGPGTSVKISKSKTKSENPLSPWEREARRYGYDDCYITTYETLRGRSEKATAKSPSVLKRVCGDFQGIQGDNLLQDYYKSDTEDEEFYSELIKESDRHVKNVTSYSFLGNKHCWNYSRDFGLVEKIDLMDPDAHKRGTFTYDSSYSPTMAWIKFCQNHIVLLILDEAHATKNDTQQNRSCAAAIRAVRRAYKVKGNTGCYVGILTATPLDKPTHSNNYFKLLGNKDPVKNFDMFVFPGAVSSQECYREALTYNQTKALEIAKKYKMFTEDGKIKKTKNPSEAELISSLWIDCVLNATHSAMIDVTIKILCNGFFNVNNEDDLRDIAIAYSLLEEADALQKLGQGGKALSKKNESSRFAEDGMTRTLARRAFKHFQDDPDNKIVLGFNHISNVERAKNFLLDFGVSSQEMGTICGDEEDGPNRSACSKQVTKEQHVDAFQRKKSFRILIMTIKSGGTAISLHDQVGQRKRYLYMAMGNDLTAKKQFGGRGCRFGNQSVAEVYICYPKIFGPDAMRHYDCLVKKSANMRRALESTNDKSLTERERNIQKVNIRLPGEYDRYFEPPSDEFEDRATLWDYPIWVENENEEYVGLYPPPKEHGFIDEDNLSGRLHYKNTKFMIDYVQSIWDQNLDKDSVKGIYFKPALDKTVNQFPREKYPSVQILQEIK